MNTKSTKRKVVALMNRRYTRLLLTLGLVALVVAAASAIAGAASKSAANPFTGIAAANHPRGAEDAVDAATAASMKAEDAVHATPQIGSHLLAESRSIGSLSSGRRIYLVPTDKGGLCVAVARLAETCSAALSDASPVTFTIVDADGVGGAGPVAYGVATDRVRSLSFSVAGRPVTVRVHDNLFVFRGRPSDGTGDFSSATVLFTDGATSILR
jgi:hypothetical protein